MPFFCPQCGSPNPDGSVACQSCGYGLHPSAELPQVLPPGAAGTIGRGKTNGYAIASVILGLLICFCPASALAVLYGHRARKQIRNDPTQQGIGLATAGLVLGYLGLAFGVFAIFAALPDFLLERQTTDASSLRAINTSEVSYSATFPKQGYSPSLQALGDGGNCPTPPTPEAACLIDSTLASGVKSGYRYIYRTPSGQLPVAHYTVNADPVNDRAGRRHFFTDETGIIRSELGRPASSSSPPL